MMHEPDCPKSNHGRGGKNEKKDIDSSNSRSTAKTNEKNALKISDDKVISAINQHLTEAKKKPANPAKPAKP